MAGTKGLALAIMLVLCLGDTHAVIPGSVVRITQKGLDYALQKGMTILKEQLSKLSLPDITGTYKAFLGNIHYSFSSLVISSFQQSNSQVSLVPGVGLKLTILGSFIQVDGQKKIRFSFLSDDGTFNVKMEDLTISIVLKLGNDGQGRPTALSSDCSSHIKDLKVQMPGKFGWVVKLFHDKVSSELKTNIEQQICPAVTDLIRDKLKPFLETIPVIAKIDEVAAIDYSLTAPPNVTTDFVEVYLKGEVFDLSNRIAAPYSPPSLSLPMENNLMVYFGAANYLFNTAAFVYYSAGALVFNVTDDMIPKDFQIRLNTTYIGALIPQVLQYPNMLMKLKISSSTAPYLTIKPGNLTLSPVIAVQAYALLPNSSLTSLFLLNVTTDALVRLKVNSSRIVGNLELKKIEMTLVHSDVGPFSVELLNVALNYYIINILLPRINVHLMNGYPLPLLDNIQISDIFLQPQEVS
ncbi:bactericidal permeability-increasing protein-like [Bombina bombina]|uniref:bactericidal permeability-increasing protein-like n=1 Tax=Bombina bombina TaxID=8345 RepID=UPI00235A6641|nr:bactericidal permeability-increasing protein-like [Bombina bombina]